MKVSPAFSKAAGCRGSAPARAPQSAEPPLCFIKRRRGSKGEPSPGVPPSFLFLHFLRVRRYFGRWSLPCPAFRPHFFGACPKKRCRAAKEKRFFYPGVSTIRVSASASVVVTHLRPTWGGAWWLFKRLLSPGANVDCYGRFARSVDCAGVTVVIRFRPPPKETAHTQPPPTPTSPLPKSGEDE